MLYSAKVYLTKSSGCFRSQYKSLAGIALFL